MHEKLQKAVNGVDKAKQYLQSLHDKYANEPDILAFYEPSAREILRRQQQRLLQLISEMTDSEFELSPEQGESDIQIRIVGQQFQNGKGPIGIVGSYLQKVNVANQHAVSLLERKKYKGGRFNKSIYNSAMFDLAHTKAGSLILGLTKPEISNFIPESKDQQELFPLNPWETLLEATKHREKSIEGFHLLVKVIASVEDPEILNELKNTFDERDVLKLIHYAKELAPSSLSTIDEISFEGMELGIPVIRTNKQTRKMLDEHAQRLKRGTKYVETKGFIGVLDLLNRMLLAKPLWIGEQQYKEVRCKLNQDTPTEEILRYAEQIVKMAGYMEFDSNNQPIRLDVDEISLHTDVETIQ